LDNLNPFGFRRFISSFLWHLNLNMKSSAILSYARNTCSTRRMKEVERARVEAEGYKNQAKLATEDASRREGLLKEALVRIESLEADAAKKVEAARMSTGEAGGLRNELTDR